MIKFGTDGWRGIIGDDFTFDNLKIVSQAIADYLKKRKGKRIVIGYDSRFLSREFAFTVARVISANGIEAGVSDQIVPTPVVSFSTYKGKYDLGIMITASHNPGKFNGLKIKTMEGGAADKDITDEVEKLLYRRKFKIFTEEKARDKKLLKEKDFTVEYKKFLKTFFDIPRIRGLKLNVLIDLMHGSGRTFCRDIASSKTLRIDYLRQEHNPSFGNMHPEPVKENLGELIRRVKKDKYDLGVALDGDGDRVALINGKGEFVGAQQILPLLALHMIQGRKESGSIGKTVVGSNLIDVLAADLGVGCFETPVGFKYISNLFKDNLICIGGEEAGGIGFKGYVPERDGNASFLMVLEMLAFRKKSLDALLGDLYKKYGRWYYLRTSLPLSRACKSLAKLKIPGELLGKKVDRVNRMDGIKIIAGDSWLMFRKSGTEPIVRVYAEAKTLSNVRRLLDAGNSLINAL